MSARDLRTAGDVFRWADSFTNLERSTNAPFDKRNYRLDRMHGLLRLYGNPEQSYRVFHIAGTKGKGSTAALMAAVLEAAGEKIGLYTSPHVATPLERISVNGEPPEEEAIVRLGRDIAERLEAIGESGLPGGFPPTTFELLTLLAFLCFRDSGCSTAVVETGIGGRLDATNVVTPEASLITPLDLEHTEILGSTIENIAFEKAGIIKDRAPAFVGLEPVEAKEVFRAVCRERRSPLLFLDEEMESLDVTLSPEGTRFRLKLKGMEPAAFGLSLLGDFQAENAALAYLALRRMRPGISAEAYARGFQSATLPGRMEIVGRSPPLVLDGAHTPLAVRRLLSSFRAIFPGESILIFGSVAGKKPREMAEILAPAFTRVIVSTPGTFKASDPQELFSIFRSLNQATEMERDPATALRRARATSGGARPILVTGSFYMVAEIRRLLARG
jgi:dihydrofolate synthase/folylpolyglutamate synthase